MSYFLKVYTYAPKPSGFAKIPPPKFPSPPIIPAVYVRQWMCYSTDDVTALMIQSLLKLLTSGHFCTTDYAMNLWGICQKQTTTTPV